MVARRYGAAMLLNLVLERDGLCIHLLDRLRKRAREHAGLAARIDRNGGLALAADPLDGFGQSDDRPGQRPRDQDAPARPRTTPRSAPTRSEVFRMLAAGAMMTALGSSR